MPLPPGGHSENRRQDSLDNYVIKQTRLIVWSRSCKKKAHFEVEPEKPVHETPLTSS